MARKFLVLTLKCFSASDSILQYIILNYRMLALYVKSRITCLPDEYVGEEDSTC